ncbi:unnamed protein product [Caenorhabditis auriculariae]|uniref:SEC7 domain-containing protein n=1 Tax=Caenorhabditis auriculariae TaxID=2777116 RepID=A0A8S1I0M8_9PELO|nr:unnamed protein product [Caenorhabditis auriculariae]
MRPSQDWRGTTSSSRVFVQKGYQLSDELSMRHMRVLENRYGGGRAHSAAIVIQRAFREYCLRKRWTRMTTFPVINGNGVESCKYTNGSRANDGFQTSSRYAAATSLSAQLRADRATRANTLERSPPSPAPSAINHFQNNTTIDSLMSPRLGQKRFVRGGGPSGLHDGGEHGVASEVWLPRPSLATHNPAHSNSLPRLDKHRVQPHNDENRTPRKTLSSTPPRPVSEQERKRQYRIALNFFNRKPERGVQLLTSWGFVDAVPESLAHLLFGRRGLSKLMIGEYIGTLHSSFHNLVLKYFISLVEIRGLEIDVALRKAMQFFILPKEAEKIDRIIQAFAIHYAKNNPKRTSQFRGGWDTVHLLSFAIIMLNTDLHSPNVKHRMKKEDFVKNLRGQDKAPGEKEGKDINRELLEGIYERIRKDELRPGDDHVAQVARVDRAIIGKDKPRLTETQRRLVCYCRLQQVLDPSKRQSSSARERDVFLFNDMIVVGKGMTKRRTSVISGATYTLKHWSMLYGATIHEFQKGQYEFGLTIVCVDKQKLHFNARNFEDRCRFVADIAESIREATEMEQVRLEVELERHTLRSDSQRDSGLPDMDESLKPNLQSGGAQNASFRRLSFNSLDSGVVEEPCEALLNRKRKIEILPQNESSSCDEEPSTSKEPSGKKNLKNEKIETEDVQAKKAKASLIFEAKRAKERAEASGPQGWLRPKSLGTNKEFLHRTLASTLPRKPKEKNRPPVVPSLFA